MSIETYQNYDGSARYMERLLEKWGQPCTVFIPSSVRETGYEDLTVKQVEKETGVLKAGNQFTRINSLTFINFKVTKSVFYHFNWFPEEAEELCLAYFPDNDIIKPDSFVRTAQVDCVSKYGDLIFKVVDIKEDGVYRRQRRNYFLRPVSSSEVQNLLILGPSGSMFI